MRDGPPRGLDTLRTPLIERAYQLARSGEHRTLQEMIGQLQTEGYTHLSSHLGGRTIRIQLRRLREAALAERVANSDGGQQAKVRS